jgi:hypothetical protein
VGREKVRGEEAEEVLYFWHSSFEDAVFQGPPLDLPQGETWQRSTVTPFVFPANMSSPLERGTSPDSAKEWVLQHDPRLGTFGGAR